MTPERPIDSFVKRSQNILQKEYVVIGKRRISSFTAWAVIAFFVGITIAVGFLASRSGTLEGSEAARAPRPVWSSWGNWQQGTVPLNVPTVQYRSKTKASVQIVNGTKTRVRAQGYEQRQCVKNCESLGASLAASSGATCSLSASPPSPENPKSFFSVFMSTTGTGITGACSQWGGGVGPYYDANSNGLTDDTATLGNSGTVSDGACTAGGIGDLTNPWNNLFKNSGDSTSNLTMFVTNASGTGTCSLPIAVNGGGGGSDNVVVSKTYLEVSPADSATQIKLDDGSFMPGKSVTFTSVTAGNHTITVQVPANVKAYYALCTNASECQGPIVFAGSGQGEFQTGQFTHTAGQKDFVNVVYTSPELEYGSVIIDITELPPPGENTLGNVWSGIKNLFKIVIASAAAQVSDPELVGKWVGTSFIDNPFGLPMPSAGGYECGRKFTVFDSTGKATIDPFSQEADYWSSATPLTIKYEVNKTAPLYTDSQNGYAVYDNTFIVSDDGKNRVAFIDKYSPTKSWGESNAGGYVAQYGWYKLPGTVLLKYISSIDIAVRPSASPKGLLTIFGHELAHAIGVAHTAQASTASIVNRENPYNYIFPTDVDASVVSAGYGFCGAALRLDFNPQKTITGTGSKCGNLPSAEWSSSVATISEIGGKVGATLTGDVKLWNNYSSIGSFSGGVEKIIPVTQFTKSKSGSSKGFPDNLYVPAGGSISATLCQVPWAPEDISEVSMRFHAQDDNGRVISMPERDLQIGETPTY